MRSKTTTSPLTEYRTVTLSPSPIPSHQPSSFPSGPCFYTVKDGCHVKTFTLEAVIGLPYDGYVTIVWDASERPAPKRLLSWVHLNPPNVRKPPSSPISLLTTAQGDDDDHEDSDDDDESPEYKRAKAQVAHLEGRISNHRFRADALIPRAEGRAEYL
jgi:hypothetical protein